MPDEHGPTMTTNAWNPDKRSSCRATADVTGLLQISGELIPTPRTGTVPVPIRPQL